MKIISTPELVEPSQYDLDDFSYNQQYTKEFLKNKQENWGNFSGKKLWHRRTQHGGEIIILSTNEQSSLYVMKYIMEKLRLFDGKISITQILVWKSLKWEEKDVAYRVMMMLLRREASYLLCDKQQTTLGKIFWQKAMEKALKVGHTIGFINNIDKAISYCYHVHDYKPWLEKLKKYWQYDPKYQEYYFFIQRV